MAQGRDVLADALLILGDEEGVGLDPEAGGFPLGASRRRSRLLDIQGLQQALELGDFVGFLFPPRSERR